MTLRALWPWSSHYSHSSQNRHDDTICRITVPKFAISQSEVVSTVLIRVTGLIWLRSHGHLLERGYGKYLILPFRDASVTCLPCLFSPWVFVSATSYQNTNHGSTKLFGYVAQLKGALSFCHTQIQSPTTSGHITGYQVSKQSL